MGKPSTIPVKIGFYLLLLFSFSVAVFPSLAYFLAAAAFVIWLLEIIIFRKSQWASSPLFYAIAGFVSFSVVAWAVSGVLFGSGSFPRAAVFLIFYFVAREFVPSPEKRKMVVWTLISGVVLASGIDLFHRWENLFDLGYMEGSADPSLSFLMVLVFCLVIAYYAQAEKLPEKMFFGLITLPAAIVALFSFDWAVVLILLFIFLAVGIIKDRSVFVVLALAAVIVLTGLFGIKRYVVETIDTGRVLEFIGSPAGELKQEKQTISLVGFYGSWPGSMAKDGMERRGSSFLLSLLRNSGPLSIILFFWVLAEQARRDLIRIKKVQFREARAYHLASLLIVVAVFISSFYAPALICAPAILGLWLLLGMAEA